MFRWAFIIYTGFSLVFGCILLLAYIWMAPWLLILIVGFFWLVGRSLRKNYRRVMASNSLADGPQTAVKAPSRAYPRTMVLRCGSCGYQAREGAFHGMDAWSCPRCGMDESNIEPVVKS